MSGLNLMDLSNYYIYLPSGLTILINMIPIITFINFFFHNENFDTIPIYRMITNYINSIAFFFYSSIIFNIQVRFANLVSAIISLVLILIYFYLELSRYLIDAILNLIILVLGTSVCYQWLSKIIIEEKIVGRIYLLTNLTSIIIQMQYVYNGICKKNYLLIPITFDSISFPCYLSWFFYGILFKDFYIAITNIICCVACLVKILIYFFCRYQFLFEIKEETDIGIVDDSKKESTSDEEIKARPVRIVSESF